MVTTFEDIEKEFDIFQDEQRIKCDRLLKDFENLTKSDLNPSCSPFFDSILCWPRTAASQIAKLPCPPQYLSKYTSKTTLAVKECMPNGEWFTDETGVAWSNYSLCISSDGKFLTSVADLNFDTTEYEEKIIHSRLAIKWLPIIKTVSQIGHATSFTVLVIAFLIFSLHRKLQNPRNRLHMHLFASFIARSFMALFKDWLFLEGTGLSTDFVFVNGEKMFIKEHNTWICKAVTSIWQYCLIVNYSWILMEGLYLHRLIFSFLCADTTAITFYIWLGWGLPVLVVVPWVIVRLNLEDVLCWTTNRNPYFFLIIRFPILILILFNFLLFLNIVRVLFVKLKTSVFLQRKKMQYRKWARSTLILAPLLGIHHTLLIGLSYSKDHRVELIWLFFDQLFGSFQVTGGFIAFLYCFLNSEVRSEVQRSWKARKSKNISESLDLTNRNTLGWLKLKFDSCRNEKSNNVNIIST